MAKWGRLSKQTSALFHILEIIIRSYRKDYTMATRNLLTTKEATFLKRLHRGSCTVFATVLGPEANEAHRDHFHLDMKERRSGSGVCH